MVEKSPAVSLTMERPHDCFLEDDSQESNPIKRSRTGLSVNCYVTKALPPLVSHNPLTLQASVSGGDSVLPLGVRVFKKLHQDVKAPCVVITPIVSSYVDRL